MDECEQVTSPAVGVPFAAAARYPASSSHSSDSGKYLVAALMMPRATHMPHRGYGALLGVNDSATRSVSVATAGG